jgi:predicted extracellular nuclease
MGISRSGRISRRVGIALVALLALLGMPLVGVVTPGNTLAGPTSTACDGPATPISEIQGPGDASLLGGQPVTIKGVVTADFRARERLSGFFVQDPVGDGDPQTSDAVFVFVSASAPSLPPDFGEGQLVRLSGTVREFNNLTEIVDPSGLVVCGPAAVQPTSLGLLDLDSGDLERFENMLVTVPEQLTVTETFKQGRYGVVALSFDGRRFVPTTIFPPDSPEAVALDQENPRRVMALDDASPAENPNPVPYLGESNTLRVGDTIRDLTGILAFERESTRPDTIRGFRLEPLPGTPPAFVRANPRTPAPEPVGGTLKVASANVLNYFNGDGLGGGFETSRGARNQTEFLRQRQKVIAALAAIDADIVGLMEMENDGTDPHSAIQDLVNGLNDALGASTYDFVREPSPGTDAIKAAMLYKPARVTRVGEAVNHQVDETEGHLFERAPLAQTFRVNASGELLTVVTNHWKSKNCGDQPIVDPGDREASQGRGCFNARRVRQAGELLSFVNALQAAPTDRVLVIGDLNSYGQERPIQTLTDGGLVNEIARHIPTPYSYVFNGASGYLDHALTTASLSPRVTGVAEWHINADEPTFLSYDARFAPPGLFSGDQYRASDHDPVIIGLDL